MAAKKSGRANRQSTYLLRLCCGRALPIGLLLCLNRKIHRAFNRVREGEFFNCIIDGFDMYGKTIGVIAKQVKIGQTFINIMLALVGKIHCLRHLCRRECQGEKGRKYVGLIPFLRKRILFLCIALTESTHHLINEDFSIFARCVHSCWPSITQPR